jgi:hypothetical protein
VCIQRGARRVFQPADETLVELRPALDILLAQAVMASTSTAADFHAVFNGQKSRE